ncbi:TPA: lysA protein [Escherichia coli]|nr:lysA protein [Escherichia coli]MDY7995527.1 DNZ54_00345 family protein [Escherichia coli]HCH7727140.1 lysA protein [Escherichia coli]HCI2412106.1 lysA protein [Escherichia coli]HCI2523112.1 lysA protein [Escherichia coli]
MKQHITSLIFDFLLVLMLFMGLTNPQSVAVNFVAVWALFGCLVCIAASLAGVAAYEHWQGNRQKNIPLNDALMRVFRLVFCRKPSPLRRFWSLLIFAGVFACLVGAGWGLTALLYLICVLVLKAVRSAYRQRIEGEGVCPDSL